ncbi:hypothetical protein [Nostoc mirabile]|nr:hypothetical protein [Nostoc mirabile]
MKINRHGRAPGSNAVRDTAIFSHGLDNDRDSSRTPQASQNFLVY